MKQVRYYVSRKNLLTWLAAALSAASVVLQVLSLCQGRGSGISSVNICFQKVLPMAVAVWFALLLLVSGEKSFYRTTTPVFWGCVYFGQIALDFYLCGSGYVLFSYLRYVVICWLLYFVLYVLYRLVVTGKLRQLWLLRWAVSVPAAVLVYDCIKAVGAVPSWELLCKIANCCLVGSLFLATLAMARFTDGAYHKTWGDRSDGRRLRTIDGMSLVGNYMMPNRNGASNYIRDTLELTAIERYIHKKRAEGMENFGITHVFLAAYIRCAAKYPGLNRFIAGQRVYQRDDDIQFTMAMKKDMRTDGEETMIKLHLSPSDTATEVYEKYNRAYEEVKSTPLDSGFDSVAGALASVPGLLLKFVVWALKVMDYFGKIPKFLLEVSPFHASVIFTSMGSLGIPPVYHHLYDFGNMPVFIAFGRKYRKTELDLDGTPVTRRYLDFTLNCDERTVDGFYYATVLKYFHKIMRKPDVLDHPPAEIVRDID